MFEYFKTNKKLKEELEKKTKEALGYKTTCFKLLEQSTAVTALENELKRGITWYDFKSLPTEEWREYFNEAQEILKGKVLNNEINAFILDLVQEIALRANDFNTVLLLRSKINVLQVFRDRLNQIFSPDNNQPTNKDPHSVI